MKIAVINQSSGIGDQVLLSWCITGLKKYNSTADIVWYLPEDKHPWAKLFSVVPLKHYDEMEPPQIIADIIYRPYDSYLEKEVLGDGSIPRILHYSDYMGCCPIVRPPCHV